MTNLGLGVMIQMLGGNKETVETFQANVGKTIASLEIEDDKLVFGFADGTGMSIWDNGQSCCEERWMHTDDPLDAFVGGELYDAEVRDGPEEQDEWGQPKESQFLIVSTSKGQFTVVNYNVHNGYYGGFWLVARPV